MENYIFIHIEKTNYNFIICNQYHFLTSKSYKSWYMGIIKFFKRRYLTSKRTILLKYSPSEVRVYTLNLYRMIIYLSSSSNWAVVIKSNSSFGIILKN